MENQGNRSLKAESRLSDLAGFWRTHRRTSQLFAPFKQVFISVA